MAIPDQQFQTIVDNIEQTVKDTITTSLKQAPTSPTFDPNAFRKELVAELTAYIDEQVDMLMGMLRRIAVELYEATGDEPYQSGMIEAWRDHEEENELEVFCTACGYEFMDEAMNFCPHCGGSRGRLLHSPAANKQTKTVISSDLAQVLKKSK